MNSNQLDQISVLYVEDEDDIRESLVRFLRRRIGNLYIAENGKVGLALFEEKRPDIVITDIRMPEVNGLDMARQIRKTSDVPIIITTGHNDEQFFLEAIDVNVDKYIKKPVDYKILEEELNRIAQFIYQKRELREKNEFIRKILDVYPGFLMITDGVSVRYMNQSFMRFLGLNIHEDVQKQKVDIDRHLVVKENSFYKGKKFHQWISDIIRHPEMDYVIHLKGVGDADEDSAIYLASQQSIPGNDLYLVSFTDITLVEIIRLLFHEQSIKDPMTRVYNRKKFFEILEEEIERSQRYRRDLSLVMFDIDFFKRINDDFGHQEGDRVLLEIVALIRSYIRTNDIFGRYGGEEFVILLPETCKDGAFVIAERLREDIMAHDFKLNRSITSSFGIAEHEPGEDIDHLIKKVDDALYKAKNTGRNKVVIYNTED